MNTKVILGTALTILLLGIATRPHGLLGQIGMLLAGASIFGLALIKLAKLYRARKPE